MKYRVKKRWPLLGVALTAVAGLLVCGLCFREATAPEYLALKKRANPLSANDTNEPYRASQQREGVRKEFWQAKAGSTLKAILDCSSAELAFEQSGEGQAVVELMNDVACEITEMKPGGILPTVRAFEASRAEIHYATGLLVAEDVAMTLPDQVSGQADRLVLATGKEKDSPHEASGNVVFRLGKEIEAQCGKATFHGEDHVTLQQKARVIFNGSGALATDEMTLRFDGKGIRTITCNGHNEYQCENDERELDLLLVMDGEIFIDNVAEEITLFPEGSQLFFRDNQRKIYADRAMITYAQGAEGFAFRTLILEGNVRLNHREGALLQYVLADRVLYDHGTREMRFLGSSKSRALFFDKINDLKVSASEIKVTRDPQTQKEKFEGVGDVRFHFAEGEFERLRKQFLSDK